jgi:hypothetical protein
VQEGGGREAARGRGDDGGGAIVRRGGARAEGRSVGTATPAGNEARLASASEGGAHPMGCGRPE